MSGCQIEMRVSRTTVDRPCLVLPFLVVAQASETIAGFLARMFRRS